MVAALSLLERRAAHATSNTPPPDSRHILPPPAAASPQATVSKPKQIICGAAARAAQMAAAATATGERVVESTGVQRAAFWYHRNKGDQKKLQSKSKRIQQKAKDDIEARSREVVKKRNKEWAPKARENAGKQPFVESDVQELDEYGRKIGLPFTDVRTTMMMQGAKPSARVFFHDERMNGFLDFSLQTDGSCLPPRYEQVRRRGVALKTVRHAITNKKVVGAPRFFKLLKHTGASQIPKLMKGTSRARRKK